MRRFTLIRYFLTTLLLVLVATNSNAQALAAGALVDTLRQGRLVIVMRHTSSPRELPDAATVNPDNAKGERQLDAKGRDDAAAIGESLRRLRIPVTVVMSSPAYRALETARLAGLSEITVQQELSNEGMAESTTQNAEWLRAQATYSPERGNRLLITHGPNISAAFPEAAVDMEEGDMLVFDPQSSAGPEVVAKIKVSDWAAF